MFITRLVILVVIALVALAGIVAYLRLRAGVIRHSMLRQVDREMNRAATINRKHTKAARGAHDKAEAALFAVIKARDESKRVYEYSENAAEHLAQLCKGDD